MASGHAEEVANAVRAPEGLIVVREGLEQGPAGVGQPEDGVPAHPHGLEATVVAAEGLAPDEGEPMGQAGQPVGAEPAHGGLQVGPGQLARGRSVGDGVRGHGDLARRW